VTDLSDHEFMSRALRLAGRGIYTTDPNPRVGCVLVNNDSIVGEGWHQQAGGPHAEIAALNAAGDNARGATAYVTLEPCCHQGRTPPCTDALIAAGVARVVFASDDPNPAVAGAGAEQLAAKGIEVVGDVMQASADLLNVGYMKRRRTGRPYVRSKIAASLDGRTALANGESRWITGAAARADVQRLRARSSAVLTGVGTILSDDPSLNVRDATIGDILQPIRVIADSRLRTPADARTLALPGEVRIYCVDDQAADRLSAAGAGVEVVAAEDGRVSLPALLDSLGNQEVNELLVEAGPGLNGALLAAGLVDELIVYSASHILGSNARGMFDGIAPETMDDRTELKLVDLRRVGDDCRLTYRKVL
jgi:diaminohydroxyphosphoribosylaminopyrimidine deaminase/5-amino-6-(5-phosphoribosylamino)uracil reductase